MELPLTVDFISKSLDLVAKFNRFEFERPIEFRENYYDGSLHRQTRIKVTSSKLESLRYYFSLFFRIW